MDTDRQHTAYHEAGHAVLGWYAGIIIKKIAVGVDIHSGGFWCAGYTDCTNKWGFVEITKDCFVAATADETEKAEIANLKDFDPEVLFCIGGAAAQIIWDSEGHTDPWLGSSTDRILSTGEVPLDKWKALVHQGVDMLKTPAAWQRVERVASELHKRKALGQRVLLRAIKG